MTLTTTEIRDLANKYYNQWMDADPTAPDYKDLREQTCDAIAEALEKQEAMYASGARTLMHERDKALEELAALRMHLEVGH